MSGISQGIPQRLTAFVDPKTGLISDTWYRFQQSLWQRTGGSVAPGDIATLTAAVEALQISVDALNSAVASINASLVVVNAQLLVLAAGVAAVTEDAQNVGRYAEMAEPPMLTGPDPLLGYAMGDVPIPPENNAALVAMVVT